MLKVLCHLCANGCAAPSDMIDEGEVGVGVMRCVVVSESNGCVLGLVAHCELGTLVCGHRCD
jgi:hypothetical protein